MLHNTDATHQFGKWHQGFFVKEHTPIYRGFNSSYGFLTGGEDHYSEATICGAPVCGEHPKSIDIWDSDRPAYAKNGTWSAQLFAEAAIAVVEAHAAATPLFLYFAVRTKSANQRHLSPSSTNALLSHLARCTTD